MECPSLEHWKVGCRGMFLNSIEVSHGLSWLLPDKSICDLFIITEDVVGLTWEVVWDDKIESMMQMTSGVI